MTFHQELSYPSFICVSVQTK